MYRSRLILFNGEVLCCVQKPDNNEDIEDFNFPGADSESDSHLLIFGK